MASATPGSVLVAWIVPKLHMHFDMMVASGTPRCYPVAEGGTPGGRRRYAGAGRPGAETCGREGGRRGVRQVLLVLKLGMFFIGTTWTMVAAVMPSSLGAPGRRCPPRRSAGASPMLHWSRQPVVSGCGVGISASPGGRVKP